MSLRRAAFLLVLVGAFAAVVSSAYASEPPETSAAGQITATSARLHGVLNPNSAGEPGTYHFNYGTEANACEEGQLETPRENSAGAKEEAEVATVENLLPATSYTFCLVAANPEGIEQVRGPLRTFRTPSSAPTVTEEAVTLAGPTSVLVSAEIGAGGLSTSYHVEWVSQAQFEESGWSEAQRAPSEEGELPAASAPVPVSAELQGLHPSVPYRFRFAAKNSLGSRNGAEETLTSASEATGAALPDGRSYELVSVPGSGEPYLPPTPLSTGVEASGFRARLPNRAAASGEAIAYVAEPSPSAGTGETGPGEGNQWLAKRANSGWQSEDITPAENSNAAYQSFSSDLETGLYEGNSTPLTTEVQQGCAALYARSSATASFKALFTEGATPAACGHPLFAGASAGESQIIFQSEAALTPNAKATTEADVPAGHNNEHRAGTTSIGEGCMFGCNLYDWSGGTLHLVNVLEGKPVPSATFGGYVPGAAEFTNYSGAISNDGSRIFWTDTQEGPDMEHVYVLEDGTTNVPVSGALPAEYWAASADGRYAYYTEAGRLWRFDTDTNTREALTEPGSEVQGVIGTNQTGEAGAYVYFVASGAIPSAPNARNETPTPGSCAAVEQNEGCNLYVIHGGTHFIATLSSEDGEINSASEGLHPKSSDWRANLGERLAEITPDGRHLVFQSHRALTGYSGVYQSPEGPRPQTMVFTYSAEGAELSCASCSPTGAPPSVEEGSLKSKLPVSTEANTYMRRWVSDNGTRVFFDSAQPLAPQDRNAVQDVYEWERAAVPGETDNSCTTQAASPTTGGCTFLISGTNSKVSSFLVDADASGSNVFFEHIGPLGQLEAPVDHNELYDARVNGGFPKTAVGCTVGSCERAAAAPAPSTPPASVTFGGNGNFPPALPVKPVVKPRSRQQKLALALKSCKKYKKKAKRHSCEGQARKRYGPAKARPKKHAKRASSNRRAHS